MQLSIKDVFTYPYDNDLLLRKRKSIRKQLLARDNVNYIVKKIAILGGSTTSELKDMLELFLLSAGIKPIFYESEYNKFYEDAVYGNDMLENFQPEIIIVFSSSVNILHYPQLNESEKVVNDKLELEFSRLRTVWESLSQKYKAVIIQTNFDMPYIRQLGDLEATVAFGRGRFIERLNEMISEYVCSHAGIYIFDIHRLSSEIGLRKWHNRFQYSAYKMAMDYSVIPDVANGLANIVKAILGKSKKCLVLDLDNTLWGGVIGDDGVDKLQIGHETPEAEAFTEFQRYVLELKNRGVILAVCSKNDMDIAKTGFGHPDSVLKIDDFVAFYANWEPKNVNINAIAQEINIGLDSLVFIDDNPVERQIVRDTLPEVAVPEVDSTDVFSYIRAIEECGFFTTVNISSDDIKRTETYNNNRQRHNLENEMGNYDDFLISLDMYAEIGAFKPVYFDRIAQLTNKTNQFNLTTMRYTYSDIEQFARDENFVTLYGRLKDKFGDNGLITVIIGEKRNNELHIILWLMSCRVIKRGMEQNMMDVLCQRAIDNGCAKIIGYYNKSEKNAMVAKMYESFDFTLVSNENDDTVWELDVNKYVPKGKYMVKDVVK